ncbi:MAG: ABC transporter ATP-binding protein [Alphaproteobacteria bacterium]|nr:ABC transporter ATP-binding protein [Alphaproteobacteria bacterium]
MKPDESHNSGSPLAIQTDGLSKAFDEVKAVDSLNLGVRTGTITGLLGGNGAGKSTTMAMLLGLLQPTSGSITLLGHDLLKNRKAIAPFLNFSSPYVDLPNRLTVRQNLIVYGHLYGVPRLKERIAELAEQLQMTALLDRHHGTLSAGQRTRATLAKSLLNKPRLLLLDEPTASLDPDTADWVRTLLMEYSKAAQATIFMASHNMYEVERMCDDVIIMKEGRVVNQGSPQQLLETYGRENLEEVFLDIARNRTAAV